MTRTLCSLAALAALTACTPKPEEPITNSPPSIEGARFAASLNIDLAKSEKNAAGLYWRDITPGTGDTVRVGQTVRVTYDGRFPDGSQFETNQYEFRLGSGRVIAGWDQGIVGMRVGGKRQLIIPASLGYQEIGSPPVIPPNAVLIFTIEMHEAK